MALVLSTSLQPAQPVQAQDSRVVLPHSAQTTANRPAEEESRSTTQTLSLHAQVAPSLLKHALQGDEANLRFIVEMAVQTNLNHLSTKADGIAGRALLVDALQTTAQASQVGIRAELEKRRFRGQVVHYQPFWIFNGLQVTSDADTLLALAARPDIRRIREDRWRRWVDPPLEPDARQEIVQEETQWNIARIRADLARSALGLNGEGVTVAILDTGVDWLHPALQVQYRGFKPGGLAVHEGNWLCTTDEGYLYPVDGHGHGTHVAGTAVGSQDGDGRTVGVAPGARWIAVKMLDDQGRAYDSWIHAALQWLLAPNGDPSLAPDIVNGSWGNRNAQDEVLRPDLTTLRAAGIVPIFSSGNEGPSSSSLRSPASYPEAIAVGATDDLDQVTSFSSRGPSPWGEIKPELVAPGAQIRSSLPGGTFGMHNGTSMAAPHVTGLVALMRQADPTLSVDEIEEILTSTATPIGDETPNNHSGWGRIDAYRAAAVAFRAGFVAGQITRYPDQQPLTIAQITAYDHVGEPQASAEVDDSGHFHLALPAGRYNLEAKAFGFEPRIIADVEVQADRTTNLAFELSPSLAGVLWGKVTNAETGGPVEVPISAAGTPALATSDPQTGEYSLTLPAGTYTIQVARNGYRRHLTHQVQIVADEAVRLDIDVTPAPTLLLVDSGGWYYDSQAAFYRQALEDNDYVYNVWEIRDLETDLPDLEDLVPYDVTIWSSPQDAPGFIGAGEVVGDYLGAGGNLLLSGQDVGFWDGGLSGFYWAGYYYHLLKALAIADDAGRQDTIGLPDELLRGLSLPMNGSDSAANQMSPDGIALSDPVDAAIIARYESDGEAALRASQCQSYRAIYLAAGLEGLGNQASRAEVMDRALSWLAAPHPVADVRIVPSRQERIWLEANIVTYTVELQNTGRSTDRFSLELSPSTWPAAVWNATFTQEITETVALDSCAKQIVGVKVTVPDDVAWNTTEVVTLTARSQTDPARTSQAIFQSKVPAPILLVDDHRWHDTSDRYQTALDANHLPHDVWTRDPPMVPDKYSPSLQRLRRYPLVIWFTAHDWSETLTTDEESRLAAYLDGGGRLLFSSQDHLYTSRFTDFARHYLGVASYTEGLTTTQTVGASGSPIADGLGSYDLLYPFGNWSDSLKPVPAARVAFWGQHAQPAALTLDDTPWKTAFFAFPLESLQEQDMATVMGRTVQWLSPLGDSTLAVDRPVATAGDELTYTLSIQNTGPELLEQVSLSNTVPPSTTYIADSLQGPADADYDPLTNRFTWDGPLASGQAITVSYRLQLHSPLRAGTVIRNYAHLTEESGLAVDRLATTRINVPDLSASAKTASAREASPNQVLTYTLTLRNDGLQPAQAHLTDPIPLYTMYEPGSATASSGQLTSTLDALQWTGTIPTGHEVTITFPAVISPTTVGLYVLNRATLTDGWGETQSLEAYTWVEMRIFLPLVLKQH